MLGLKQYADVYLPEMAAKIGDLRCAHFVYNEYAFGFFDRKNGLCVRHMDFCSSGFISHCG